MCITASGEGKSLTTPRGYFAQSAAAILLKFGVQRALVTARSVGSADRSMSLPDKVHERLLHHTAAVQEVPTAL